MRAYPAGDRADRYARVFGRRSGLRIVLRKKIGIPRVLWFLTTSKWVGVPEGGSHRTGGLWSISGPAAICGLICHIEENVYSFRTRRVVKEAERDSKFARRTKESGGRELLASKNKFKELRRSGGCFQLPAKLEKLSRQLWGEFSEQVSSGNNNKRRDLA